MNWTIRKGTPKDADTIAGFQVDMAMESEGTVLDSETLLKGVTAGLSDPAKGTYFVVTTEGPDKGGEIVGSMLLTKEWSDWNNCWYWWIQSVYIRPEFRRMGAFSAMYDEIRRMAKDEGSTSLRLYVDKENIKAQECYRRNGMDECHYLMFEENI